VINMSKPFKIEVDSENSLDSIVRILGVLRRSKLRVTRISVGLHDKNSVTQLFVEGVDGEVNWVRNKLEKLYDVYEVDCVSESRRVGTEPLLSGNSKTGG
jgi:acetolactate synthase regulatory subunit